MLSGRLFYTILAISFCGLLAAIFAPGSLKPAGRIVAAHGMHRTILSSRMDSRRRKPYQSQIHGTLAETS